MLLLNIQTYYIQSQDKSYHLPIRLFNHVKFIRSYELKQKALNGIFGCVHPAVSINSTIFFIDLYRFKRASLIDYH